MFVTANQIYVFIACVSLGVIAGPLFTVSKSIKYLIKNKIINIISDVFVFSITTLIYIIFAHNFNFPNIRVYMIVGVFVGIVAYLKSFHIILAKLLKMAYNIIKRKKVKTKDDRGKNKKANSSVNGRGSIARNNTRIDNALSAYNNK